MLAHADVICDCARDSTSTRVSSIASRSVRAGDVEQFTAAIAWPLSSRIGIAIDTTPYASSSSFVAKPRARASTSNSRIRTGSVTVFAVSCEGSSSDSTRSTTSSGEFDRMARPSDVAYAG